VIVRWGLDELPGVLVDTGAVRPLLVASRRWIGFELPVQVQGVWSQVPTADIEAVAREAAGCDGILALGGGSAIDLAKAVSAETGLTLVSVPTTYAGAEWTTMFGIRDEGRRIRGAGAGSRNAGIVYDAELTLGLPREVTAGTALNALAHCAEALYVQGHNPAADEHALAGTRLIAEWLPRVVAGPKGLDARTELLRGACHGGAALAGSMLALAHAMAQAIGGRYGLPHGTLNGICLPPVLRFNTQFALDAVARFGEAVGDPGDPAGRVEQLAALAGPTRLHELGVPEGDLAGLAADAAQRGGNLANPKPASPDEIERLLRDIF
jgi:maleylacetate reductase